MATGCPGRRQDTAGDTEQLLYDRATTDRLPELAGDGSVVGSAGYDVFGAVTGSSGSRTPFGFTGAPQSGDLVHLNARDLDTGLGRFLSTDPARPGAPGAVGWNQYTYVANNPATLVDPSGALASPEYAATTRPAIAILPILPVIAFEIIKRFILPAAVVGVAAFVATRTVGPEPDVKEATRCTRASTGTARRSPCSWTC